MGRGNPPPYLKGDNMTLLQIQCLLQYLGYYTIAVDGIWGPGSTQATKDFQKAEGLNQDGDPGELTQAALIDAVANGRFKTEVSIQPDNDYSQDAAQYLKADGYYHIPRGVNVQLSKNLWSYEVMCQGKNCCDESIISKRMVETFQKIRDDYGGAIEIATDGGSGYRCSTHNAGVGGAKNSLHLTGSAFDLHCADKQKLLSVCEKHITDGEIGIYSWGIHAGVWIRGYVNRFYG